MFLATSQPHSVNEKQNRIEKVLLPLAFGNLVLVAILGLALRSAPLVSSFPLVYKNLLHAHSHFAFGGWVLPVLTALVLRHFPEIKQAVSLTHWRNITILIFVSAYGMLLFFPLYGYKGITIFFSTASLAATVYLAVVVWKAGRKISFTVAHRFLVWGLGYAVLSALGPFATVPLIVAGKSGSPLYFDVVYFYLHFQYNGFFTFTVLALLYRRLQRQNAAQNANSAFWLFNCACVPAYALSVLWHQPSLWFNVVGGLAALLQLAGLYFLWKDLRRAEISGLFYLALLALVLKCFLQAASAFPDVAALAHEARNLVIAYLHLVLLGFVSLFVFALVNEELRTKKQMQTGIRFFLFSFLVTETLLVVQAFSGILHYNLPGASLWLFLFSLPFPVGALLMTMAVYKSSGYAIMPYKSFLRKERTARASGATIQTSITTKV